MGACTKTMLLIDALESQEMLKLRGFSASCGPTDSVVVDRWGHVRGIWHVHNEQYYWTSGASSQPTHVATMQDDAVAYTLQVIAAT